MCWMGLSRGQCVARATGVSLSDCMSQSGVHEHAAADSASSPGLMCQRVLCWLVRRGRAAPPNPHQWWAPKGEEDEEGSCTECGLPVEVSWPQARDHS